jgi:hypothetical protein
MQGRVLGLNGFFRAGIGAAAAVLCAFALPASGALAGYQAGGFSGTTDQLEDISFRADEGKVRQLSTVVFALCDDGTRQEISIVKGRTGLDGERFSLELDGKQDLRVAVNGKLRGERAGGRIEAKVKPQDTVCRADVRWQATLAKPAD